MKQENISTEKLLEMITKADYITILSHLNPDADALGTSLGIYALLSQDKTKKVEVVNASVSLPLYLDFLPHFKKIKHHMDYEKSLVISCDCGSIDRLGFNLDGREIINIDHHQSNTNYGKVNIVIPAYASSSQVAYSIFKQHIAINKDAATCFYVALLSDTRYFTTKLVNEEIFSMARHLVKEGANPGEIAYNLTQRRSLSSLRILERALHSLSLYNDAKVVTLVVTQEDIDKTGATMPDMEGIVDYAKSLVTVEIAIFAMELENEIRISLRSKELDVSRLALYFGGGGHKLAAGFTLKKANLYESIDTILEKIKELNYFKK